MKHRLLQILVILVALFISSKTRGEIWFDSEMKISYEYTIGNDEASVYYGRNAKGAITIRSKIQVDGNEYIVKSIGQGAFWECSEITSVTIPSSVTLIGNNAFTYCRGLTSITIPSSVTCIGDGAFFGCSSLNSANIPNSITSIGESAFSECGLTSVTIPSSVTAIGKSSFSLCRNLKTVVINDGITVLSENMFSDCSELSSLSLPSSVTTIDVGAFQFCKSLSNITFPSGLTKICKYAFYGCSGLCEITIPSSLTFIGKNAFQDCTNLNSIYIKDLAAWCRMEFDIVSYSVSNPLIHAGHLYLNGTEIKDLVIPDGVTSIEPGTFSGCKYFTSVTIPSSVKKIGRLAFQNCSGLTRVSFLSITEIDIEGDAFYGCKNPMPFHITDLSAWCKKQMTISTTTYKLYLNGKEINDLVVPEDVKNIASGAFKNCRGLSSVTFPSSVTSLGTRAFYGCVELEKVSMPASIRNVGVEAFSGCNNLNAVYITDLAAWLKIIFCSESEYSLQPYIGLESNPLYYAHHLFLNGEEVTDLIIPDGTNTIGKYCFGGCEGLSSITFPSSVSSIGTSAFSYCKGLTEVIIPNNVATIEWAAFSSCTGLRSLTIGSSVSTIEGSVFNNCKNLERITSLIEEPFPIENGVFMFYDSNERKYYFTSATLYVPAGTKAKYQATGGWNMFENIVEMKPNPYEVKDDQTVAVKVLEPDETGKVEIPEKVEIDGVEYTVTEIAEDAFKGNTELTEVTIPGTVTTIGSGAFEGCTNLKAIYILSPTPASLAAAVSSRAQHKVASTAVSQFEGIDLETCVLYVPFGSEQAYREAEGWKEFRHIVGVHGETDPMLTVTAKSYSREYGEENPEFEFTTEGATLDGDPVLECEATAASAVGTYDIVVKKGGVKNYNDTYVKGTLTITKAPLTVTVQDAEREQGKENPQFVLTYTGWKNGETESVLTKKPVATTTATKESPAGVYDIVVSGGEAQNYELSYVSGTLTVTVPSSINLTPPLSQGEGAWYDLQGRKIKGQSVKKGVYVVNGRKVVIK